MGRSGTWFASVKNTLSPNSKKLNRSKSKGLGKEQSHLGGNSSSSTGRTLVQSQIPRPEEMTPTQPENEIALAATVTAESTVSAAPAAAEVAQLTSVARFTGKSAEEAAAMKIQTAFRGYLARRALRSLHGLERFKSLTEGCSVQHQTTNTLRYLQTFARLHYQIHSRRIRMFEEDEALRRQFIQKQQKELLTSEDSEEWDDSLQSKEQTEAKLARKHVATMKRERALAYAFSHQPWKNISRSRNLTFMEPCNPHWGWSWLERWVAGQPWERNHNSNNKELITTVDRSSSHGIVLGRGEISRAYARHQLKSINLSPSTPNSKACLSFSSSKLKPSSPRRQHRRHTIGGSSVWDRDSSGGVSAVPSFMVPTKSAKAKTSASIPPMVSAKKQLSFVSSSPEARR